MPFPRYYVMEKPMSKKKPIRKRLIALIKPRPKRNSSGAPMPGGKVMQPDGSIEREKR